MIDSFFYVVGMSVTLLYYIIAWGKVNRALVTLKKQLSKF